DDIAAELRGFASRTGPVATGLHGLDDTFGAACRHEAGGACRGMEQIERHADDLVLHALDAREGALSAKRILAEILEEGGPAELVDFVVGLEDEQRRTPVLPVAIDALEALEFIQHRFGRAAVRGKP